MNKKLLLAYGLGLASLVVGGIALHGAWEFLVTLTPPSTAQAAEHEPSAPAATPPTVGPPWRYGRSDARITVIEYADLECPYCRAYFPVLRRWVDAHPDVNWEWHHLPLSMHEPAASAEARLAECVGRTQGPAAFWGALAWVYAHTRSNGEGLPEGLRYPALTPTTQKCLDSDSGEAVRTQAAAAQREGVAATPTLRLVDHTSGKTLLLPGPVEGDALLSAIDMLVANEAASLK